MSLDWHQRYVQQAAWTRDLRAYLFDRAGLSRARCALEVGCGTGAILASLGGGARVHGLDQAGRALLRARREAPQAILIRGDAHHLPYPNRAFDVTFCHFLLLWVRDPLRALIEMARVTRRGGAVLALAEPDYGARVDQPPALQDIGRWQRQALLRQGADPDLGRRLTDLFERAGLTIVEAGQLQPRRDPPTPAERELEWAVLEEDLRDSVPSARLLELKALDALAWERGERVQHVPTHFAFGRV